jgi:hypothetical protein
MDWEAVFCTRSVQQLRDATVEELLEAVFSMLVNTEVEGSISLEAVIR